MLIISFQVTAPAGEENNDFDTSGFAFWDIHKILSNENGHLDELDELCRYIEDNDVESNAVNPFNLFLQGTGTQVRVSTFKNILYFL